MMQKIILLLLGVLLCAAGGTVYYSFTLNQRLDDVEDRLQQYQAENSRLLDALDDKFIAFQAETAERTQALAWDLASLQGQLDEATSRIEDHEGRLQDVREEMAGIDQGLGDITSRLEEMKQDIGNIADTQASLSRSIFDASHIFASARQAIVRITDGVNTIGSGFIFDENGHVMTAFHVIDDLTSIIVVTDNGTIIPATVTGYNEISDIGILKLAEIPKATPLTLGDSSRTKIGEPVAAIGSPLDIRDTVTAGIVSRLNRYADYGLQTPVPSLIQFDAPVNPGNSGGPLLNSSGEVIGVVVARILSSQGEGIYYAVSSNKARRVASEIIARGSFAYPWLGIIIGDITPRQAQEKGLKTASGVLVSGVTSGGPAQAAGIFAGDVIVAIDGTAVADTGELTSYLGEYKSPGNTAVVEVIRGQEKISINVTVGTRP